MKRIRALLKEAKARRAGQRNMPTSISRATRDIVGPTGWVRSNAWDELDEHKDAYVKSFDRRVPPSIFIADRDNRRFNQPIPVAERCLEDLWPNATRKR